MSERPSDVPEWAWEKVRVILALHSISDRPAALARALAAERERCAAKVEAVGSDLDPEIADHLAAAIRSGE